MEKMIALRGNGQRALGLFELDEAGNVLYSSFDATDKSLSYEEDLKGTNFFTGVIRFANAAALQRRFELFRLTGTQAQSFDFVCDYSDGKLEVRVLLARIFKNATNCSFLLHLRQLKEEQLTGT